jgi:hypothetical protein
MGALAKIKHRALTGIETVANFAGLFVSVAGATVAAVFGKLVIGLVLGAVAVGFLLRLKGRRAVELGTKRRPPPVWVRPVVVVLSALEVSALVEATNLPVRFSQDGFAFSHWYIVGLLFAALYLLQVGAVNSALARRGSVSAA